VFDFAAQDKLYQDLRAAAGDAPPEPVVPEVKTKILAASQ
jgi:hypothetical protein